jgi:hypothetical protein
MGVKANLNHFFVSKISLLGRISGFIQGRAAA